MNSTRIRSTRIVLLLASLFTLQVLLSGVCLPTLAQKSETANESVSRDAAADAEQANSVVAHFKSSVDKINSSNPFTLSVDLQMAPGWHTYYKEPGDAGMPTKIEWALPAGFQASELIWPKPEKFNDSGIVTYGYEKRVQLSATITPPARLPKVKSLTFTAKVKWLACKDLCVPGKAELTMTIPVKANQNQTEPQATPEPTDSSDQSQPDQSQLSGKVPGSATTHEAETKSAKGANKPVNILNETLTLDGGKHESIWIYFLFAFIGGFILNFMPCVLPVISIKILSFMEQAGEDPKRVFRLGLTFCSGILASFLFLALLVITIQQAGQKVGWGFQFQNPLFLIGMSVLLLVFALSLFGLFYVSCPGQSSVDKLACKEGHLGTFGKGVLATTLSTPCTAPFLGAALGFAFSQSQAIIIAIFLTVGLGMAFPYLLLTANPAWMKYLPKPGAWMETFKQAMGFLLLATVVWLLWVLGDQVGLTATLYATTFLFVIGFATWFNASLIHLDTTLPKKSVVWLITLGMVAAAWSLCIANVPGLGKPAPQVVQTKELQPATNAESIAWLPFTLERLNAELASGKTVFLDFTADWCLTCKVNEQTVINTKPVVEKFHALNVVALKADWTSENPEISKIMQKFGRSGVPLYVIFPGGNPTHPIILPEVVTPEIVMDKLDQAGSRQAQNPNETKH
jgi:thiol:disulfide interchange protein DsbD